MLGLGLGMWHAATRGAGAGGGVSTEPLTYVFASDAAIETSDVARTIVTRLPANIAARPFFPVVQARLTVQGAVAAVYIGPQAGTGDVYDASSLVQVTFGGNAGVTQAASAQTASDTVAFAWDRTSSLIIAVDVAAGDQALTSYGGSSNYFKEGVQEAGTPDKTGYSLDFSGFGVPVVQIEFLSGAIFHPRSLFTGANAGVVIDGSDPFTLDQTNTSFLSIPAVGDNIAFARDLSGNDNHLQYNTIDGAFPKLGGSPGAYFIDTLTSSFPPSFLSGDFAITPVYTRIASWRRNAGEGSTAVVFGSSTNNSGQLEFDSSDSLSIDNAGGSPVASISVGEGEDVVTTEIVNGASSSLDVNGSTATGNAGANTPGGIRIGSDNNRSNSADISLYRLVFIDGLLTDAEVSAIQAWCSGGIPA